jgi:hypothetical protein
MGERSHFVDHRIVFTYQPERWPEGVLTGYVDLQGGFVLEHVIAFKPRVLVPMLEEGIDEARRRGYRYLLFGMPHDFPLAKRLTKLATRFGFERYAEDEERFFCVRHL